MPRWLSRAELGMKTGFSEEQIVALESGRLDVWVSDCVRLMRTLQCSPVDIFMGRWTSDVAEPETIAEFVTQVKQVARNRRIEESKLAGLICESGQFDRGRLVKLLKGDRFVVMTKELEEIRQSLTRISAT